MKFIPFFVPWKLFSSQTAFYVRRCDPPFVLFWEQTSTTWTWTKFSSNETELLQSIRNRCACLMNPSSWWKFGLEVRSSTFWHFLASSASWFKVVHNYDWTMYWWNSYTYIYLSLSLFRKGPQNHFETVWNHIETTLRNPQWSTSLEQLDFLVSSDDWIMR